MKEYTRQLKEERKKDLMKFHGNNSKAEKRTPEEQEKATADKKGYYLNKWKNLKTRSVTRAQREICTDVLNRVNNIKA